MILQSSLKTRRHKLTPVSDTHPGSRPEARDAIRSSARNIGHDAAPLPTLPLPIGTIRALKSLDCTDRPCGCIIER